MITEPNKLPSLALTQDITVQTQTGTQTRDEIKRLVLDHCSIAEAAWHLFVSVLQRLMIPQANRGWHDLTFSLSSRPVDKQEFDGRLQPGLICKQPRTSANEKLWGKLFSFSYWSCSCSKLFIHTSLLLLCLTTFLHFALFSLKMTFTYP